MHSLIVLFLVFVNDVEFLFLLSNFVILNYRALPGGGAALVVKFTRIFNRTLPLVQPNKFMNHNNVFGAAPGFALVFKTC